MNIVKWKQSIYRKLWLLLPFALNLIFSQTVTPAFPSSISLFQYSSFGNKQKTLGHLNIVKSQENKQEETPLTHEIGYILAQQIAFGGLSYLASRKSGYGPYISGGFDVFIGGVGALNLMSQIYPKLQIGYAAITLGFFAKTAYTFKWSISHTVKEKFWASYLAYNLLIYFGYYLDSL